MTMPGGAGPGDPSLLSDATTYSISAENLSTATIDGFFQQLTWLQEAIA